MPHAPQLKTAPQHITSEQLIVVQVDAVKLLPSHEAHTLTVQ